MVRTLVLLGGAAVLLACGFKLVVPASVGTSGTDYYLWDEPVARNLLAGRGYVHHDDEIYTRRPPGYPLILVGLALLERTLGLSEHALLRPFELFCTGTSVALIYLLARRIWGPWLGLIPPIVWMTYPLFLMITAYPNSEMPFVVLFALGLLVIDHAIAGSQPRSFAFLAAGILAGLAMLVRPIGIGLGVIMATLSWLGLSHQSLRERTMSAALVLLGNVIAVAPWTLYVSHKANEHIILASTGPYALLEGLTFAVNDKNGGRVGTYVPEDVRELMQDVEKDIGRFQSASDILKYMTTQTGERPLTVAKLLCLKAARSWYGTDSQRWELPILCLQGVYLTAIATAGVLAWKRGTPPRPILICIVILTLYFWGMNILSLTLVRYSVPIMWLLFLLLPALGAPFAKRANGQALAQMS